MFVLRAVQTDNKPVPCERWQFSQLPIRIGRNPANEFAPQHQTVSGFHAQIEEVNGQICIRDVGSTNGVFLTRPGAAPARIPPNCSIELAPVGYRFYLGDTVLVQLEFAQQQVPVSGRPPQELAGAPAAMARLSGATPSPSRSGPVPPTGSNSSAWSQLGPPTEQPPAPRAQPPRFVPAAAEPQDFPPPPPWDPAKAVGAPGAPAAPMSGPLPVQPHHPDPDEAPKSQFFDVQLDALALQGLRELARSLISGRQLETTGDVARLITKLHDTVDVFCRCFVPLRQGHDQFVTSLDLASRRSVKLSSSAALLEVATSPEAIAKALLDPRDQSTEAPQAAERILTDLARHQVALLDGVMQGVRALLDELSPESIEATLEERGKADVFGAKYKNRWTEYCERYDRLRDEREAFALIFGQDFAEVYRDYWKRGGKRDEP